MAVQQVDRLGAVIEQVRTDLGKAPEPPIATFSATTSLVDEYRTKVNIREFSLDVDEPPLSSGRRDHWSAGAAPSNCRSIPLWYRPPHSAASSMSVPGRSRIHRAR